MVRKLIALIDRVLDKDADLTIVFYADGSTEWVYGKDAK